MVFLIIISLTRLILTPASAQQQCLPGSSPCIPCIPNPYGLCVPIPDTGIIITSQKNLDVYIASIVLFTLGSLMLLNGKFLKSSFKS